MSKRQANDMPSYTPVRHSNPYSGVKRDRTPIATNSPVFGDLPIPVIQPSVKRPFLKNSQFVADDIQSPAAKMIKRENASFRRNIKLELDAHEEESASQSGGSSHSSPSTSSSQGGNRNNGNRDNTMRSSANGNHQQQQQNGMKNYQNGYNKAMPSLFSVNFGQQSSTERPFCYNCKQYGHIRRSCRFDWYHWWPSEYLFRYPWLRRKVQDARKLWRSGNKTEYRRMAHKMEDDVEEQDRRKRGMYPTNQNQYRARYFHGGLSTAQSREDGQKILQAIRRNSPAPRSPQLPCCPEQYQFSFDCQKLVEDLQRQVAQLQIALIRSGSVSPPRRGSEKRGFNYTANNVKKTRFQ